MIMFYNLGGGELLGVWPNPLNQDKIIQLRGYRLQSPLPYRHFREIPAGHVPSISAVANLSPVKLSGSSLTNSVQPMTIRPLI